MENTGKISSEELNIQNLLSNYLRLRVSRNGLTGEGQHLDEDSLSAFVEGTLGQKEALPIVNHLVDCTFCRHVTAELIRLDFAFADEEMSFATETEAPSKISEVLSGILGRIFGTNDGVVFAHHESEEESENIEEETEKGKETDE